MDNHCLKPRASTKGSLPKFQTNSVRIQKWYSLSDALAYIARIRITKGHFSIWTDWKCQPAYVETWSNTAGVAVNAGLETFHCTLPVYFIPEIEVSLKREDNYSLCWFTYFVLPCGMLVIAVAFLLKIRIC